MKNGGLGIGLYQVKGIVEAHGGRIEVESGVGRGSTFRVLLPKGAKGKALTPEPGRSQNSHRTGTDIRTGTLLRTTVEVGVVSQENMGIIEP